MGKLVKIRPPDYPVHLDSIGRITTQFVTSVARIWAERGGTRYFDKIAREQPQAYRGLITRFVLPHLQRGVQGEVERRHNYPPFARLQEDFMIALADHFVAKGHGILVDQIDEDPVLLMHLMEALAQITERPSETIEATPIAGRMVDVDGALARLAGQD